MRTKLVINHMDADTKPIEEIHEGGKRIKIELLTMGTEFNFDTKLADKDIKINLTTKLMDTEADLTLSTQVSGEWRKLYSKTKKLNLTTETRVKKEFGMVGLTERLSTGLTEYINLVDLTADSVIRRFLEKSSQTPTMSITTETALQSVEVRQTEIGHERQRRDDRSPGYQSHRRQESDRRANDRRQEYDGRANDRRANDRRLRGRNNAEEYDRRHNRLVRAGEKRRVHEKEARVWRRR